MQKDLLFIVLARKNSKRIKNKNMKLLFKKPLISWTLEQAFRVKKKHQRVILSTDDEKIIGFAKKFKNLEVINRPKRLSTSSSSSIDAINHAIDKIRYTGNVVLLQPTSPLRIDKDILTAINLLKKGKSPLMSVCKSVHDISLMTIKSPEDQKFKKINKKKSPVYFPNGAIYAAHSEWLKKNATFHSNKTYMYFK